MSKSGADAPDGRVYPARTIFDADSGAVLIAQNGFELLVLIREKWLKWLLETKPKSVRDLELLGVAKGVIDLTGELAKVVMQAPPGWLARRSLCCCHHVEGGREISRRRL